MRTAGSDGAPRLSPDELRRAEELVMRDDPESMAYVRKLALLALLRGSQSPNSAASAKCCEVLLKQSGVATAKGGGRAAAVAAKLKE